MTPTPRSSITSSPYGFEELIRTVGGLSSSTWAMRRAIRTQGGLANVNSILRVPGGWHGVFEPRAVGAAAGY